ncbi:hypothetical protein ACNKHU_21545 [Shigella flexneri]
MVLTTWVIIFLMLCHGTQFLALDYFASVLANLPPTPGDAGLYRTMLGLE